MEGQLGIIKLYITPEAPAGWALCDGRTLHAGTHSDLAALLGNRFGGGPGEVGLPDLRDPEQPGHFMIRIFPGQDAPLVSQIVAYAGEDTPEGYLPCDGSHVPVAQYPVLAEIMREQLSQDQQHIIMPQMPGTKGIRFYICAKGTDPRGTLIAEDDED